MWKVDALIVFSFFTALSAILAAGFVTLIAIGASWLLRSVVGETRKSSRRKFFGDENLAGETTRKGVTNLAGSPFEVLGFSAVPSSFEEIRSAFLRESNRTHPDQNPGDGHAARRFDSVKKAYEQIGTPQLFRDYVVRHPPEDVLLTFDGKALDVLTVDEFASRYNSLRASWQRAEAEREAALASRLLGASPEKQAMPRLKRPRGSAKGKEHVWIDDVVFQNKNDFPTAQFFRVFDCLVRVDQKVSFYNMLRLLLVRNGFVDTFSDVKGHANSVTIIGDLAGNFIFPKPVKVLISHDDPPARLFTRLWDLELYRGPRVQRVR